MLQNPNWDKPLTLDYSRGRQALIDAAAWIRRHGWYQGGLEGPGGGGCIVFAIRRTSSYADGVLACQLLKDHLGVASVAMWNDQVCQSQEQAIETLAYAAR